GAGARLGLAVVREALDLVAYGLDGDARLAVFRADHAVYALALPRWRFPGLTLFRRRLALRREGKRVAKGNRQDAHQHRQHQGTITGSHLSPICYPLHRSRVTAHESRV